MLKTLTLIAALLCAGTAFAEIPKNPTRDQIIASCTLKNVTVQERVALQQCKTSLDAAELIQAMYVERINDYRQQLGMYADFAIQDVHGTSHILLASMRDRLQRDVKDVDALIESLKAAPAPKPKKKKG
jgi:hypothetical protein